jgi:integrase
MTKRKQGNGEGSIRNRADGRWEARLVYVDGARTVRRSIYAKTRAAAARELRDAIRRRERGERQQDDTTRAAVFWDEWLTGVAGSLRPASVRRYRQVVSDHLTPCLGPHRLCDLAPQHVQTFYAERLAAGLSPATVRLIHFVLHRSLEQAVRWGRVSRNVSDLVDVPRLPRSEAQSLTADQARHVLDIARDDRLYPLLVLALTAGPRRGELIALRWADVDLDKDTLCIRHTMQPTSEGPVLSEPKSASSHRTIQLGALATEALRIHKARQVEDRLLVGELWVDGNFVFTTDAGGSLPPMSVTRMWAACLRSAGIPHMPFHATRHTAASLMVEAGVSPRVAAERLGHATVAMTLDRYSHLSDSIRTSAATAIDAVITTPA